MTYEPTNWKSGDVVTSAKLNKIEQGIVEAESGGGGVFVVHTTFADAEYSYTTDKTWTEIFTALSSGTPCILLMSEDPTKQIISVPIVQAITYEVEGVVTEWWIYVVNAVNSDSYKLKFSSDAEDGYCVWIDE